MTPEANKELARKIWAAVVAGDWGALEAAYAEDAVYRSPGPTELYGRTEIIELTKRYREAFPDLSFEILDIVADGDIVATRGIGTGTHRGEFNGLAPTGKSVAIEIAHFMRIVDGHVVEEWEVFDTMDMLRQLGVTGKEDIG